MIEKTKKLLCDSRKDKLENRKSCRERITSNIALNLISVSVLPQNVSWSDMEGFVGWKYGSFKFSFRNAKDEIVAGIDFYFTFQCKGQYNSTGQYLAEVTISPYEIFANTGYKFTCNVSASDPINKGTKANPTAGVVLKVQMQVKSHHKLKVSKAIIPSSRSHQVENKVSSKIPHLCRNGFYTEEQYINVLICGDGKVSILSAYGY